MCEVFHLIMDILMLRNNQIFCTQLYGSVENSDVTLYSVHRKNSTTWRTFPYKTIKTSKSIENRQIKSNKHNYFGVLEEVTVHTHLFFVSLSIM